MVIGAWRWFRRPGSANAFILALLLSGSVACGDDDDDHPPNDDDATVDDDDIMANDDDLVDDDDNDDDSSDDDDDIASNDDDSEDGMCHHEHFGDYECILGSSCAFRALRMHNYWPYRPKPFPYCECDCDGAAISRLPQPHESDLEPVCACDGQPNCLGAGLRVDEEAWKLRDTPCERNEDCMLLHKLLEDREDDVRGPDYYPLNVSGDLTAFWEAWNGYVALAGEECEMFRPGVVGTMIYVGCVVCNPITQRCELGEEGDPYGYGEGYYVHDVDENGYCVYEKFEF